MMKRILNNNKEVVWLQVTAGQGPKESGWVVAKLQQEIIHAACNCSLSIERVEMLAFDKNLRNQTLIEPDAFLSVLLRIEGIGAKSFSDSWQGTIKWQGESPYRIDHKRVNWFVAVLPIVMPSIDNVDMQRLTREVDITSTRSGGPGGQHVNKTNSAVQLIHRPTGIRIRVETDRSQHRNRRLAMERLYLLLVDGQLNAKKENDKQRWMNHCQIERGNAIRVFSGAGFVEETLSRYENKKGFC
jgi:peptide chain release factor